MSSEANAFAALTARLTRNQEYVEPRFKPEKPA
jgi:hypothetical protein